MICINGEYLYTNNFIILKNVLYIYNNNIRFNRIYKCTNNKEWGATLKFIGRKIFWSYECYTEIIFDLDKNQKKGEAVINNFLDIGNFLRRES